MAFVKAINITHATMKTNCPHEGLSLQLSVRQSGISIADFCFKMSIPVSAYALITGYKRLDQMTRARAAGALGLSEADIFCNKLQRVWLQDLPFTAVDLQSFASLN